MLQLADETPFRSGLALMPDPAGIDTLFVSVKATFTLGPRTAVAAEQQPLHPADVYADEPATSSLVYAGEVHLAKPATDVALVGSAHAPAGRPVDELETLLRVGPLAKRLKVVGERRYTGRWIGSALGPAAPFERMPLTYERAFGGTRVLDADKGKLRAVETNPIGRGLQASRRRRELVDQLAPNVLDPKKSERPAGYGFIAPHWMPRRARAGTYDEAWQRGRAPYLPQDFDPAYFNAAHPDLVAPGHLAGGEPVELVHLSPQGDLRFALPALDFEFAVRVAGDEAHPELRLETVLFEPDEGRFSMLWRAALGCDKRGLAIESVRLALRGMEHAEEHADG